MDVVKVAFMVVSLRIQWVVVVITRWRHSTPVMEVVVCGGSMVVVVAVAAVAVAVAVVVMVVFL